MNPAIAPVHLTYYPLGGKLFPASYGGTFFFGSAESSGERGAGVWQLSYDVRAHRVVHPPSSFVRFRRPSGGEVAGVALGPDGLYFAPIVPSDTGASPGRRGRCPRSPSGR